MKLELLSDVTSQALRVALEATAGRQLAIADNIANVDTPGFVRSDVQFEEALAAALQEAQRAPLGASGRLRGVAARARPDYSATPRADGNNVDIDREMAALVRTALSYRAAAEMLGGRIRMLRAAVHQGRR